MALNKRILILLLIAGAALAFSCKKNTEQDIKGTWQRMIVEDATPAYSEYWIFNGEQIEVIRTDSSGYAWTVDKGNYIIKAGLSKKYVHTSGFGFAWWNNLDWSIEKLKGGQLILFSDRDNYFLYYEFVKKQ